MMKYFDIRTSQVTNIRNYLFYDTFPEPKYKLFIFF